MLVLNNNNNKNKMMSHFGIYMTSRLGAIIWTFVLEELLGEHNQEFASGGSDVVSMETKLHVSMYRCTDEQHKPDWQNENMKIIIIISIINKNKNIIIIVNGKAQHEQFNTNLKIWHDLPKSGGLSTVALVLFKFFKCFLAHFGPESSSSLIGFRK